MVGGSRAWLFVAAVAMSVDSIGVLPVILTGAMAVQINADIGLGADDIGLVFASYFGAAALLSAPLSRVPDRIGVRNALRLGLLIYAVALLGIAGPTASASWLCGFVAVAGFATALTRTASSVLVADNVVPGRQGIAFGIKHCSVPVATLLAGLAVPGLALTVGWRWAYVVAACLSVVLTLGVPADAGRRPVSDKGRGDMSRKVLILAAACFGLGSSAASSLGAYTVSTAVSAGVAEGSAGVLVAVGSVIGLASRLGVGHWSDSRPGNQLDLISWMMALGGLAFCLLAVPDALVVYVAAPLAFATGWAWLGSYNLAMVRLNPVAPGAAVGVTQTGAFIGAIFGPASLGLLAEHYSFSAAWIAAAAASFAAAATISVLRRLV